MHKIKAVVREIIFKVIKLTQIRDREQNENYFLFDFIFSRLNSRVMDVLKRHVEKVSFPEYGEYCDNSSISCSVKFPVIRYSEIFTTEILEMALNLESLTSELNALTTRPRLEC